MCTVSERVAVAAQHTTAAAAIAARAGYALSSIVVAMVFRGVILLHCTHWDGKLSNNVYPKDSKLVFVYTCVPAFVPVLLVACSKYSCGTILVYDPYRSKARKQSCHCRFVYVLRAAGGHMHSAHSSRGSKASAYNFLRRVHVANKHSSSIHDSEIEVIV
jgi:hypothetical protein